MLAKHATALAKVFHTQPQLSGLLKEFEGRLSPTESVRIIRWHGTDCLLKVVDNSDEGVEALMAMITIDGCTGEIKRGTQASFYCARGTWKGFLQQRFRLH